MKAQRLKKRKVRIPHTLVIICAMILLCGVMTWFIPAGQFDHAEVVVNGSARDIIVPGSYHPVQQAPQTWQIFGAFLKGFQMQAAIIVGLSRQTTVLAYQLGDGFTNMITPTSAVLMGALGIAKVPYDIWFKWW